MNQTSHPLIDSIGLMGNIFETALVLALGFSTILVFIYLWKSKRLDLDEEAAQDMVKRDDRHIEDGHIEE